jgi:hypothetical protein
MLTFGRRENDKETLATLVRARTFRFSLAVVFPLLYLVAFYHTASADNGPGGKSPSSPTYVVCSQVKWHTLEHDITYPATQTWLELWLYGELDAHDSSYCGQMQAQGHLHEQSGGFCGSFTLNFYTDGGNKPKQESCPGQCQTIQGVVDCWLTSAVWATNCGSASDKAQDNNPPPFTHSVALGTAIYCP